MEERFWTKIEYVPLKVLVDLWNDKEGAVNEGMVLFAAIANEFAHGDITRRPWGAAISPLSAVEILLLVLQNAAPLTVRADRAGADMGPIVRSFVYLILIAIEHLPAKVLAELIEHSVYRGRKAEWPDFVREIFILPIVRQLFFEMKDICTSDCRRVSGIPRSALMEGKDEVDTYWRRFDRDGMPERGSYAYVWLEKTKEPCVVGFKLDAKHSCPLVSFEPTIDNLGELLKIIKKVAAFRKSQATKNGMRRGERKSAARNRRRN
jgi:hypothetical protein